MPRMSQMGYQDATYIKISRSYKIRGQESNKKSNRRKHEAKSTPKKDYHGKG